MENEFSFSLEAWNYNCTRLTNQIFKLLPMYENGEDWEKQLQTILLELKGYNEMFHNNPGFMTLIAKLFGLSSCEDQMAFRKMIFESLSLLKEIQI